MVERGLYTARVAGSIPVPPTYNLLISLYFASPVAAPLPRTITSCDITATRASGPPHAVLVDALAEARIRDQVLLPIERPPAAVFGTVDHAMPLFL